MGWLVDELDNPIIGWIGWVGLGSVGWWVEKVLLDRLMGEEMGGKYVKIVVKVWDAKKMVQLVVIFGGDVMVVVHPFLIELEFR